MEMYACEAKWSFGAILRNAAKDICVQQETVLGFKPLRCGDLERHDKESHNSFFKTCDQALCALHETLKGTMVMSM